ncbi:hypothetical protein Mrose_01212 [Calidithermus roseus]|uniref:Uncharacterized protein n=1 Tax=Calidithermus roseus TaxID=1644118 RepID=A0A399EVJ2_9DEIN|nr:hypothetical protein Mrose_01212 [Calidithermus roseus]
MCFEGIDHPEDLAYFLRRLAEGMQETPQINVNGNCVEIDCSAAPRMLNLLEGMRDHTVLPYIDGEYLRFRNRGPIN